jgi:hypothetical protein
MEINKRLIDLYGSLTISGTDEPTQDLNYLWNDFLYRGKAIFTADALGVV